MYYFSGIVLHTAVKININHKIFYKKIMEKSTLISIRIDNEVLLKIEETLRRKKWWKRSGFINQLLRAIMSCADYNTITKMMIMGHDASDQYEIIIKQKENMKL